MLFQNSKTAPSSSRSRVEVAVMVGLPYVMSFMSTRRSAKKACEETAGFYPRRAAKIFSHSRHSSRKKRLTTCCLKTLHKNAIPKKAFAMNYRGQSKRHPICMRKVAFCPPRRRRASLLRCNMSDLKSVYTPPPRTQTLPRSRAARELYFSANSDILIVNRREVSSLPFSDHETSRFMKEFKEIIKRN